MRREFVNMSPEEYHAHPALGSTAMRAFIRDRLEFHDAYIIGTQPKEPGDSLRLGQDLHAAQQYADWKDRFHIMPERVENDDVMVEVNDGLRKGSKVLESGAEFNPAWVAHQRYLSLHRERAEERGLKPIDGRVVGMIQACLDSHRIREHIEEAGACSDLKREVACIMRHACGLEIKALLDILFPNSITDFKTTRFRNPGKFLAQEFWKYIWQAAHYCIVAGRSEFRFISITNTPPYEANIFKVPPAILEDYMDKADDHIVQLAQFLRMASLEEERDSQGIPASFHSDGWGSELNFHPDGPLEEGPIQRGRHAA